MSTVRSFIVRVYRSPGGHELSGTLEPVQAREPGGRAAPLAFTNATELLGLLRARGKPTRPPGPAPAVHQASRRTTCAR